ncbi:MAG: hypothetical protein M3457_23035 [Chloroflexota bacterium]|nr:hypothetical protein [Chloroflexota bacterium]
MNRGFISPERHGLIDYGFGIVGVGLPALLKLPGPARTLPTTWALAQGSLNALTDQRYAVRRIIPFSLHGQAETLGLPAFFLATVASGALEQRKSRLFFAGLFAALLTNYVLTDYDATPER